jgi:hypothetical protein
MAAGGRKKELSCLGILWMNFRAILRFLLLLLLIEDGCLYLVVFFISLFQHDKDDIADHKD